MVAQQGRQSESARLLEICLEGLRENSATNPGVGRMYRTITRVMERLGVHNNGSEASGSVSAMLSDELDMSAIIRSVVYMIWTADDQIVWCGPFADGGFHFASIRRDSNGQFIRLSGTSAVVLSVLCMSPHEHETE